MHGIVSLHEVIHDLHASGREAIILKLDSEKAHKLHELEFPFGMFLLRKVFNLIFVHHIMQLVTNGYTAVCVNGVVGPYLQNGRDLRQMALCYLICYGYAL